jgi:hypothetical protein
MPNKQKNKRANRAKKAGKRPARQASAPVTQTGLQRTRAPRFLGSSTGCRVTHREYLRRVASTANVFSIAGYPVQPGDSRTFPWLSNMAANWSRYKFHKLQFKFISETATSKGGSVNMTFNTDPADPAPTSKQLMTQNASSLQCKTWETATLSASGAAYAQQPKGGLFVHKAGEQDDDAMRRQSDFAYFFISASCPDVAEDAAVGDLWVEYDIEFSVPCATPVVGVALVEASAGMTPVAPLGDHVVINEYGSYRPVATENSIDFRVFDIARVIWRGVGTLVGTPAEPTYTIENGVVGTSSFITDALTGVMQWMITVAPDPLSAVAPRITDVSFAPAFSALTEGSAEILLIEGAELLL